MHIQITKYAFSDNKIGIFRLQKKMHIQITKYAYSDYEICILRLQNMHIQIMKYAYQDKPADSVSPDLRMLSIISTGLTNSTDSLSPYHTAWTHRLIRLLVFAVHIRHVQAHLAVCCLHIAKDIFIWCCPYISRLVYNVQLSI